MHAGGLLTKQAQTAVPVHKETRTKDIPKINRSELQALANPDTVISHEDVKLLQSLLLGQPKLLAQADGRLFDRAKCSVNQCFYTK